MKTLYGFVKDVLKAKKKGKDLDFDNVLEKFQSVNQSATGSLSKTWTAVESVRSSQEDSVEVDLKEIQDFAAGTNI